MTKKKPKNFDYALAYWQQYVGREVVVVRTIHPDAFQKGVGKHENISRGVIVSVYRELGNRSNPIIIWYTDHRTFMSSFYPEAEDEDVHFEITWEANSKLYEENKV